MKITTAPSHFFLRLLMLILAIPVYNSAAALLDGEFRVNGVLYQEYSFNDGHGGYKIGAYVKHIDAHDGHYHIVSSALWGDVQMTIYGIGPSVFKYHRGMTSVHLPSTIKIIWKEAFYYCSSLQSITIPESVHTIGLSAFAGTTSLTQLIYLANDCQIDRGAEWRYLREVIIGGRVYSIPEAFIENCEYVQNIIIPNSVTSIGRAAFWGCRGLESIVLGRSVAKIEAKAFGSLGRNPARNYFITAPVPPTVDAKTFEDFSCNLYVQDEAALERYKAHPVWGKFENIRVMNAAIRLESDIEKIVYKLGEQVQLEVRMVPEDATLKQIYWESTNPEVATVDANGLVTFHELTQQEISQCSDDETPVMCKIIASTLYHDGPILEFTVSEPIVDGVEEVIASRRENEGANEPVEIYSLTGMFAGNDTRSLAPGIYLVRKGSSVEKVSIR